MNAFKPSSHNVTSKEFQLHPQNGEHAEKAFVHAFKCNYCSKSFRPARTFTAYKQTVSSIQENYYYCGNPDALCRDYQVHIGDPSTPLRTWFAQAKKMIMLK